MPIISDDGAVVTTETHVRQHSRMIGRHDLERLVIQAVADQLHIKVHKKGVTVKVRFEDVTEGSPSYKIGTSAYVTITEDLVAAETPDAAPSPGGQIFRG